MAGPQIDYEAVFQALPGAALLLTPEFVIAAANKAYLQVCGRTLDDLLGRPVFEAFPDNPADPQASGVRNLTASLRRVLATRERDSIALQRYDVELPGQPGVFEERYWSPVNAPVIGADGEVVLIVHRVQEVTALIRRWASQADTGTLGAMEVDLYATARELQEVNERLRLAHAKEREVALALQEAMLPAPAVEPSLDAAVRYRPATSALNVCGDWYDLAVLPDGRIAVAVGDVVGHGLRAAGVMGKLRSALSAAIRVAAGPAQALEGLGLYAESVRGAECATAVQVVVDAKGGTMTYSSAGHPPPVLLHPGGAAEFLDRATDPPLGVPPGSLTRPESVTTFAAGATLVLYTDGLVERRDEDIDCGMSRLVGSLTRHHGLGPDAMADALLADLAAPGGATDDVALVVVRL